MSKNIFQAQAEFLKAGNVQFPATSSQALLLPTTLIHEEFDEFNQEPNYLRNGNMNDLKECIDLMYVCAQYMNQAVGPEKAQKLFDAVHANNMDKCIDGKLVKNEAGKIMKPPGFNKNAWELDFIKALEK